MYFKGKRGEQVNSIILSSNASDFFFLQGMTQAYYQFQLETLILFLSKLCGILRVKFYFSIKYMPYIGQNSGLKTQKSKFTHKINMGSFLMDNYSF